MLSYTFGKIRISKEGIRAESSILLRYGDCYSPDYWLLASLLAASFWPLASGSCVEPMNVILLLPEFTAVVRYSNLNRCSSAPQASS
jgi:hypothetical protein